ncbi:MAG: hypothetical protein BWY11_00607 [Firmicutes bacterium ADurb.Bin182]|nr:MAG: hypothetical protein BWY11_00607 [Firmicutes bacterium ADurb.Bin182]
MNCCNHEEHTNKKNIKNKGHASHILMMALCCGLPLLLLLVLPVVSSWIPGSGQFINSIIPFACPLMMILMLPLMLRDRKCNDLSHNHSQTDIDDTND